MLDDAVAWLGCRIRDEHDAGDHAIVVADVIQVHATAAHDPLVFFRGATGRSTARTPTRDDQRTIVNLIVAAADVLPSASAVTRSR